MISPDLGTYVQEDSALHRFDPRAKLLALAGFLGGAALCPIRPAYPWLALAAILAAALILGRVPARVLARRFLGLTLLIGVAFALTRTGSEQTRLAGEVFAVKSLLVAGGFVVLTATTSIVALIDIATRTPGLAGIGALASFVLRGVHVLVGEVVRTNRAWALRAPAADLRTKLAGMMGASVSLLGRAAGRSERVAAAMVLRGFEGRMPAPDSSPIAWLHMAMACLVAVLCIAIGWAGRSL
jgi:cobalt/nickel transport system permease protein